MAHFLYSNISPSLIDKIPVQNGAFILDGNADELMCENSGRMAFISAPPDGKCQKGCSPRKKKKLVGCASGTWVLDAATEYPASNFVGIDISDTFPSSIKPSNTDFKIGNIQDRLPFPDNTFDFINLRLFILALKVQEWPQCLRELHRVLKPGGILQCIECGMLVGQENLVSPHCALTHSSISFLFLVFMAILRVFLVLFLDLGNHAHSRKEAQSLCDGQASRVRSKKKKSVAEWIAFCLFS